MLAEEKELRPEGTGVEEALPRARVPVGDEVGPVGFTTLTPEFLLVLRDRAVLLPHLCDPRGQKGHDLLTWRSPGLGVAILSRCPMPPSCPPLGAWSARMG